MHQLKDENCQSGSNKMQPYTIIKKPTINVKTSIMIAQYFSDNFGQFGVLNDFSELLSGAYCFSKKYMLWTNMPKS